jgi:hypothetical protein
LRLSSLWKRKVAIGAYSNRAYSLAFAEIGNFDGSICPAQAAATMRSSNFLKRAARRQKKKKEPGNGFRNHQKLAAAERERAIARLFGSQGAASAVRKIDPKTGKVIAVIDAH